MVDVGQLKDEEPIIYGERRKFAIIKNMFTILMSNDH